MKTQPTSHLPPNPHEDDGPEPLWWAPACLLFGAVCALLVAVLLNAILAPLCRQIDQA